MAKFAKVEGHPNLVRDMNSGAILNINTQEHENARARKNLRGKKQKEYENLITDVNQLKDDIGEIKSLLTQLVEK